jgi:GR25 family glycosyltransferase involved in LPS biosynthesis
MNENFIIFEKSGRLGNALFRYLFCVLFLIKYKYKFTVFHNDNINLDQFIFYDGLDSINNDVIFFTNFYIDELMKFCISNDNIVAFNTLGYVKNKVDFNNLKENEYINKTNKNGIYIKKNIIINESNFEEYLFNKNINNFNNFNHSFFIKGYFQFEYLYLKYKKDILNYIEKFKTSHYIYTDRNEVFYIKDIIDDIKLDKNKLYDIIIHIRLGDFNGRDDFIEYQYLIDLFNKINFNEKKIGIVYEKIYLQNDINYINNIKNYFHSKNINFYIEQNDLITDFNIMKQCKILICSMSTLSWMASYFSNSIIKCYMPNYNFFKNNDRNNAFFKKPINNTFLYNVKTTVFSNIKAFIITLKEYPERLEKLNSFIINMSKIGINIELYYGVNGKNLNIKTFNNIRKIEYDSKIYYNEINKNLNRRPLTIGEFGCFISQHLLYEKLLEDNEYSHYLIFEDDVSICTDLENIYNHLINLPPEFDLIHLSLSDWYPFIKLNKINDYYYNIKKNYFNRNTGYIVSKSGATKLIKNCNNIINIPCDDLICHSFLNDNNFKFYVPYNYLFKEQDGTISVREQIL